MDRLQRIAEAKVSAGLPAQTEALARQQKVVAVLQKASDLLHQLIKEKSGQTIELADLFQFRRALGTVSDADLKALDNDALLLPAGIEWLNQRTAAKA